jgi:hypothetical protein
MQINKKSWGQSSFVLTSSLSGSAILFNQILCSVLVKERSPLIAMESISVLTRMPTKLLSTVSEWLIKWWAAIKWILWQAVKMGLLKSGIVPANCCKFLISVSKPKYPISRTKERMVSSHWTSTAVTSNTLVEC